MIILHELNGYKYKGSHPQNHSLTLEKNLTFIAFEITDWVKDIEMLNFLCYHIDIDKIDRLKELIKDWVKENKTEKLYLVLRRDDDIEESFGKETMTLTNIRPKEVNKAPLFFLKNIEFLA